MVVRPRRAPGGINPSRADGRWEVTDEDVLVSPAAPRSRTPDDGSVRSDLRRAEVGRVGRDLRTPETRCRLLGDIVGPFQGGCDTKTAIEGI